MLYTIYKVTNKLNGKIYIGKHQTNNPNDDYYGSGKFIKAAIKKYGKENFIKEVLFEFNTEIEMNNKEREIITEDFVSREDTYNAGIGGEGGPHFKGKNHGIYMQKINSSFEHRKKISDGLYNYYKENDHNMKGKERSNDFKNKISDVRTGVNHSDKTKEKIKQSLKGKKHSEETKEKMRNAKLKNKDNLRGPVD